MIATLSFDRFDGPHDLKPDELDGLHEAVMEAFNRHFSGYDQGARALETYRRVQADINADKTFRLFSLLEVFKAALAAHPDALEWWAFENEAAAKIAPVCFSMRFTR